MSGDLLLTIKITQVGLFISLSLIAIAFIAYVLHKMFVSVAREEGYLEGLHKREEMIKERRKDE